MAWLTQGATQTAKVKAGEIWESPLITATGGRMLLQVRWLGKYPLALNIKRSAGGVDTYNPEAQRLSMRLESPGVWIGGGDITLPDMSFTAFNDGAESDLTWSITQWQPEGGGGGTGLTPDQAADVAEIDNAVAAIAKFEEWIQAEGDDYKAGGPLLTGDKRRFVVGGLGFQMTYRGADIAKAPTMSEAKIAEWEIIPNVPLTTYPTDQPIAPKGFLYRRSESGQLLKLKDNAKLPVNFDASQWELAGSSGVGATVGGTIDLLQAHTFPERLGIYANTTLNNAPYNAGTNCTGNWYYAGDTKNGTLTINVVRADNFGLTGGIWTIDRKTTNGTTAWGSWTKTAATSWPESTNGAVLYTGTSNVLADGHNVGIAYVSDAPAYLRPKTTWDKVGKIRANDATTGAEIGGFPEWGNEVAEVIWDPGQAEFRVTPSTVALRTLAYTKNGKITDRTLALITGSSPTTTATVGAMTLTKAAVGRRIQVAWTAGTNAPTIAPDTGQKLFSAGVPGDTILTLNERDRVLTLIGRADGWQLLWGA